MFRRIFPPRAQSSDSKNESGQAPIITVTDADAQLETALTGGLRRSDATTNLLELEDTLEKMNTQPAGSTVTIVRAFRAVTVTTVTETETQIVHQKTSSFLSVRKGHEMEDTGCSLSLLPPRLSLYYTDDSSSDYECPASHHLPDPRPGIRSFSNTPDPDHLDDIWYGRITPK